MKDTEKRLINAVSTIIENEGFAKVGINKVAREAGCDKVLIYRYFGGIEGLLSAWATQNDFYTTAYDTFYKEIQIAKKEEVQELTKKVLIGQLHFFRESIMMQELILWELSGNSKFKIVQDIREQNGNKLQQVFNDKLGLDNEESNIYITVLITAIEFIVLYTRQYRMFNKIDFSKQESWERLEAVLCDYVDMLLKKFAI